MITFSRFFDFLRVKRYACNLSKIAVQCIISWLIPLLMNKWLNSIQTNKKVTFLFCMNCVGGKFLISKTNCYRILKKNNLTFVISQNCFFYIKASSLNDHCFKFGICLSIKKSSIISKLLFHKETLLTCSWHQKTNSPITNLKCCI